MEYARTESEGQLTITFTVARGARYVVDVVTIDGNEAVPTAALLEPVRIEEGGPYVDADASAGAAAIRGAYRALGFTSAVVQATAVELRGDDERGPSSDRPVNVRFVVTEGPQTLVGSVAFDGNTVFAEDELRALMVMSPNRLYSEIDAAGDRDRIDLAYRNRGYGSVIVEPVVETSGEYGLPESQQHVECVEQGTVGSSTGFLMLASC